MKKKLDLICPDCNGDRKIDGETCLLCSGTGFFSDVDTKEEFGWRYDFNG